MTKNSMLLLTAAALAAAVSLIIGCTTILTDDNMARADALFDAWVYSQTNKTSTAGAPPPSVEPVPDTPPTQPPAPAAGDALAPSALHWGFGGFNGSKAAHSPGTDPVLSGLAFGSNDLRFSYVRNLSAWGLAYDDASAICAVFVEGSDGIWRGGKFDWISTSRASRELKHINRSPMYNNWSAFDWGAIAAPRRAAFVIVSKDGRRRSNILAAEWR